MRGKLQPDSFRNFRTRITPAGAGKTSLVIRSLSPPSDHPRRCGENGELTLSRYSNDGSPPQVRGKPSYSLLCGIRNRITPAGAGKTKKMSRLTTSATDHPRRCGENKKGMLFGGRTNGSPPQVRGKLSGFPSLFHVFRITPAGAGKTPSFGRTDRKQQDHPRRCEENTLSFLFSLLVSGDHPRRCGENLI